jgi:PglZ domain.
MSSWRDQILKEFTPQVARLTLVADPDGLLLEEGILEGIRERGFELIPFEDYVTFRYAYESKFRSRWDRGDHFAGSEMGQPQAARRGHAMDGAHQQTDLVVVLRSQEADLGALPYDLLQAGRRLSFNLGDIFPNLSYPVVMALDRGDVDTLYEAQKRHAPGQLGDNATKELVLRHVFEIAPELIKQPSDLLRVLLRRHYRGSRIPAILDERLIQVLRSSGQFDGWPLEEIVPDRETFLAFLQERWPLFLDQLAAEDTDNVREHKASYGLKFNGPVQLPFGHDDVRVYIDNLFLDGLLQPVAHEQSARLAGRWASVGMWTDPKTDRLHRLEGLIRSVQEALPSPDARHQEWLLFAYRWAELTALWLDLHRELPEPTTSRLWELRQQLDALFLAWVQSRYAGLHNQPPLPPVMVHHVPRALARRREEGGCVRLAFIVVDGLALDQWVVLRSVIQAQRPSLVFRESAVFAWLPTITSVSRQAAFAGKPPLYFPDSIQTTEKEPALWVQFWADHGLMPREVGYLKGLGEGAVGEVTDWATRPAVRVLGLVVDKVDRIMHGMELGSAGMHNQVRQWATQGYLAQLLDLLLDHGFEVTISSDHGNLEAEGIGRPAEGAVADLRGERVRVYSDSGLRTRVKARFPHTVEWPPVGLPDDFLPLMAPGRYVFIRKDDRIVAHGGISIEELVVPLVHVERRMP